MIPLLKVHTAYLVTLQQRVHNVCLKLLAKQLMNYIYNIKNLKVKVTVFKKFNYYCD